MIDTQRVFARAAPWLRRLHLQDLAERFLASALARRLARGTFWTIIGSVASRLATLVGSIVAARLLGREGFGEYGMVQSTVGMFSVLAAFGMSVTATKYIAAHRRLDPERAGGVIHTSNLVAWVTGSVMTLALLLLAPWLANATLAAPELAGPLRLAAPALVLGALGAAQYGALAGLEAFPRIASATALANLAALICLVLGAWQWGVAGAVVSLVASGAVTWYFQRRALVAAARDAAIPWRGRRAWDWSMLWSFSLPAVLSGLMTGPVNWVANAMLVNRPGGYAEMGAYNAASQYLTALLFIPIVLNQALLPMLAERFGARDSARSFQLMRASVWINGLAVWPAVIVGSLLSPWLMRIYGTSFEGAWLTLVYSFATAGILALQVPVGQVLAASGRMWTGFVMNCGWALAFLAATFPLVHHGSTGLALARLIAYALHAGWTMVYALRVLRDPSDNDSAAIAP